MIVGSTGFSFGGVHSRNDMGLIYAEKDGHTMIPEIKRNAYSIAGMSGTVLLPGEAWQTFFLEGSLYPAEEPRTLTEAQALLRRVIAWLTAGRQRLIFDYEPSVFYLAEISTASKYSLRNWFGGELPIRFTVQPFAYNVAESTQTQVVTAASSTVQLSVRTGQPAPLKLAIENTGTASISHVAFRNISFSGMDLATGMTLVIDCETPVGATVGSNNALHHATRFTPVLLHNGANSMALNLTFGSGTKRATVTASARGRW